MADDIFVTAYETANRRTAPPPADDIVVARRRMRHLAPLDIRPLPVMHSAMPSSDEPPPQQHERTKELGLHLLAVHMWQAAAKTALR